MPIGPNSSVYEPSTRPETIRAFLLRLQKLYSGAEGYVKQELAFNDEEVSKLKVALNCPCN